ncbi:TatD family hydrolase [Pedobacter sp. Du54]|uniref:TatD family hydrolase n=1 Tax=Pedobacter anseongensis TaxID=3133439 RepID=UPI0030A198DA
MHYLDIHTHYVTQKKEVYSIQSLTLTDKLFLAIPKRVPISVGLHPWFAKINEFEMHLQYLTVIAAQKNVKLIGECGLDKLRGENIEVQMVILTQQILLAERLGKPLILHCVKSFSELIALKDKLKVKVPMIIHGFNKNEKLGEQLLAKGFFFSIGEAVLKTESGAAKLVQKTDRFFLETDTSRVPIERIYEHVANLKNCKIEDLKARIFEDWKKLIDVNV